MNELKADFKIICRTCLRRDGGSHNLQLQNVDNVDGISSTITEFLKSINVEIMSSADTLPQMVCVECFKKIQIVQNFQVMCQETEIKLNKMFNDIIDVEQQKAQETNKKTHDDFYDAPTPMDEDVDIKIVANCKLPSQILPTPLAKVQNALLNDKELLEPLKDIELIETEFEVDPLSSSEIKNETLNEGTSDQIPDENEENSNVFTCPYESCGKVYKTRAKFARHKIKIHADRSEHICKVCNKEFSHSRVLQQHMFIHTGKTSFLCPDCGKGFANSVSFEDHQLRHRSESQSVECPKCPKKFATRVDLLAHMVTHGAEKKHICHICGSAFPMKFGLKRHMRYHTNEKPHKCEFCEMRFIRAGAMRRHVRTHTGEKPYKCKYCEKAFAQCNDLVKHTRVHVGDNLYNCELCACGFLKSSELRNHFTVHKNEDAATRERNLAERKAKEDRLKIKLHKIPATAEGTDGSGQCQRSVRRRDE